MIDKKTLHDFTQEQHALNNISDMLRYVFEGDAIVDNKEVFNELTQKTLDLMKITDSYEKSLSEDESFLKALDKNESPNAESVIDDLTFVLLHATIAKQSLMIDRLISMLDNKE